MSKTNKPLKKSHQKTIETIRSLGFGEPINAQERTNPYTGKTCLLEPLACMLYDFITTKTLVCGKDYTRQTWDYARYTFLEQWPAQYFDLLD